MAFVSYQNCLFVFFFSFRFVLFRFFFCIFSPDLREPLDGIDDDNGRVEDGESFEIHSGRVTFEIALRQEMFVRDDVAD